MSKVLDSIKTRTLAKQNTDEWLAIRKKYITATSIAPILNIGPKNIRDLFLEKTGKIQFQGNDATRFGTYMEQYVRRAYEKKENIEVLELGLIAHPHHKFLAASPDGFRTDGALLEIKCTTTRILRENPPEYYRIQCLAQLESVPEAAFCDLFEVKIEEQIDALGEDWRNFTDDQNKHWRIVDWRCHRIFREEKWFKTNLSSIKQFHSDVQFYLTNKTRKRKKCPQKSNHSSSIANKKDKKSLRIRKYSEDLESYYTTRMMAHYAYGDHVSVRLELDNKMNEPNTIAKMVSIKKGELVSKLMEQISGSQRVMTNHGTCKTDQYVTDRVPGIFFGTFVSNNTITRIDALINTSYFNKTSQSTNTYTLCYLRCKTIDTKMTLPKSKEWNYLRTLSVFDQELLANYGISLDNEVRVITNNNLQDSIVLDQLEDFSVPDNIKNQIDDIKSQPIEKLPGMGIRLNNGWLDIKKKLGVENKLVSVLPGMKEEHIKILNRNKVFHWDDPRLIEILKPIIGHYSIFNRWISLIELNTDQVTGQCNMTKQILKIGNFKKLENDMGCRNKYLHVYMDIETTGSVSIYGERSWVFMFGIVHLIDKTPVYKKFIMRDLSEREEKRIVIQYYQYLDDLQKNHPDKTVRVCHWGHIEASILTKLSKYRLVRSFDPTIHINMEKLFRTLPILVKGVFTTRLKDVSTALVGANYSALNIQNGGDAMEAASRIYQQDIIDDDDWKNIVHYNKLDCETLFRIHNKIC